MYISKGYTLLKLKPKQNPKYLHWGTPKSPANVCLKGIESKSYPLIMRGTLCMKSKLYHVKYVTSSPSEDSFVGYRPSEGGGRGGELSGFEVTGMIEGFFWV